MNFVHKFACGGKHIKVFVEYVLTVGKAWRIETAHALSEVVDSRFHILEDWDRIEVSFNLIVCK
jgi:hypothetical protein